MCAAILSLVGSYKSTLWRLKREDGELKASLDYIGKASLKGENWPISVGTGSKDGFMGDQFLVLVRKLRENKTSLVTSVSSNDRTVVGLFSSRGLREESVYSGCYSYPRTADCTDSWALLS